MLIAAIAISCAYFAIYYAIREYKDYKITLMDLYDRSVVETTGDP